MGWGENGGGDGRQGVHAEGGGAKHMCLLRWREVRSGFGFACGRFREVVFDWACIGRVSMQTMCVFWWACRLYVVVIVGVGGAMAFMYGTVGFVSVAVCLCAGPFAISSIGANPPKAFIFGF